MILTKISGHGLSHDDGEWIGRYFCHSRNDNSSYTQQVTRTLKITVALVMMAALGGY